MKKTELKEEVLKMRFEETYNGWHTGRLTQDQAAEILGYSIRTFRRHSRGYETHGMEALTDKRLHQISHRRAPVDEVIRLISLYETEYLGWNVKHFHERYQECGGERSYSWV